MAYAWRHHGFYADLTISDPKRHASWIYSVLSLRLLVWTLVGLTMSCSHGRGRPGDGPTSDLADTKTIAPPNPPLRLVRWTGVIPEGWREIDRLQNEEKLEEAAKLVKQRLIAAQARGDSEEQVRALTRYTELRIALHGAETAVQFLREQKWPDDLLAVTALNLYYAGALTSYVSAYSWEIAQREPVDSKGPVELKAWTLEQIYTAAHRAYATVFQQREQLGKLPTEALAEVLKKNTYPERVRPTLRDAVSYLWADLLANSQGWRPEQQSELFQLDLGDLLNGPSAKPIDLTDPATHPLVRLSAVLSDLEHWHIQRAEREAALEARLERARRLHVSFTEHADRARIRADLAQRLADSRRLSWWSMGMAELAEMTRTAEPPDSLVRARNIAGEGLAADPAGIGGMRCLAIQRQIETPEFSLEAMSHDSPGKRSIGVQHRNLDALYFRAYALDLRKQLAKGRDQSLFPQGRALEAVLKQRPVASWSANLSPTPDYQSHSTQITPPLTRHGYYVITASARADYSSEDNKILAINFIVSDLALVTHRSDGVLGVTALTGETGQPLSGVRLSLYRSDWRTAHQLAGETVTNDEGQAQFKLHSGKSYFILAQKGDDLAVDPGLYTFWHSGPPSERSAALIFTDRSIYRPEQQLKWKIIAYRGRSDLGQLAVSPKRRVSITLLDANGDKVAKQKTTTNAFGTAAGEFTLPAGRLLGQWQLKASPEGWATVRVEEYKRPTFEVSLRDPSHALSLNRPAQIEGQARYYFGLPVTQGLARWRVKRVPIYPYGWHSWRTSRLDAVEQPIAAGTATLDADGRFNLSFLPKADERLAGQSARDITYRYAVSVELTDEGGETATTERSFRLGFVAVEARLRDEPGFLQAGHASTLTLMRTNLDGTAAPGRGHFRLVALRQPEHTVPPAELPFELPEVGDSAATHGFHTEDDRRRKRWDPGYQPDQELRRWADGAEQARGELVHDPQGETAIRLPALQPGAYRLRYETKDAYGKRYEFAREFIVAAPQLRLALPAQLLIERSTVRVGEQARVLATSGLPGQTLFLERYRAGKRIERRQLIAGTSPALIEIPVTEADRGGFSVSLWCVRDHQYIELAQATIVPWDNKELKLSFSSFRDHLRPGAKERWSVKVSAPAGTDSARAAAELLAYMYDRSLDAFTPHQPPAVAALYPDRTEIVGGKPSIGSTEAQWAPSSGFKLIPSPPAPSPDALQPIAANGIGGPGRRGYPLQEKARARREGDYEADAPGSPMGRAAPSEEKVVAKAVAKEQKKLRDKDSPTDVSQSSASDNHATTASIREDFSETAFFMPQLLADPEGTATISFTVPDSVTEWQIWVHAVTRDMSGGSLNRTARSLKDLMVRPYLPRFLREGDHAEIAVVVNNAAKQDIAGVAQLDITDPATGKSLLDRFALRPDQTKLPFAAKKGGSARLSFPLTAPAQLGPAAVKISANAGQFSDGELRPLPVLPGRLHLAQSRFATLRGQDRRELYFADLARNDDPTRIQEQLVVTLDTQLFYGVLAALPYLVNYPYECTEQTLNRFISTSILSALYERYPAVAAMAKKLSQRDTQLERWDAEDPNRKMALEETPWIDAARGGSTKEDKLFNVLNPRVAQAQQNRALAKLRRNQTSLGGFSWFPGGPPSPWMTIYLVSSFAKAQEFGVEVPKDLIQRAWSYLHRYYLDELLRRCVAREACWEEATFLNYAISSYPDPSYTGGLFSQREQQRLLEFSFKHWKNHSPYLKAYLALTLHRAGRDDDARLVWASVMDSAHTAPDQGTFWAPEERSWLWYNDSIETHAFAIRTLMELSPKDAKLDGLVLWLLLNKKLNHWKSTRATAEAIYALAYYMSKNGELAVHEAARVKIGPNTQTFEFSPNEYTGKKNQIVVPGEAIVPQTMARVVVEHQSKGFMLASATWHFSTDRLPEEERGDLVAVSRKYFRRETQGREATLTPLESGTAIAVGDEIEVQLSLRAKHQLEYVHLRDPRGAGFEPTSHTSRYKWDLGIYWYEEVRDSGTNFFFERLPQGEYTFKYRLRAATAGTFKVGPATVQPMYAPEFTGYSTGTLLRVTGS